MGKVNIVVIVMAIIGAIAVLHAISIFGLVIAGSASAVGFGLGRHSKAKELGAAPNRKLGR